MSANIICLHRPLDSLFWHKSFTQWPRFLLSSLHPKTLFFFLKSKCKISIFFARFAHIENFVNLHLKMANFHSFFLRNPTPNATCVHSSRHTVTFIFECTHVKENGIDEHHVYLCLICESRLRDASRLRVRPVTKITTLFFGPAVVKRLPTTALIENNFRFSRYKIP